MQCKVIVIVKCSLHAYTTRGDAVDCQSPTKAFRHCTFRSATNCACTFVFTSKHLPKPVLCVQHTCTCTLVHTYMMASNDATPVPDNTVRALDSAAADDGVYGALQLIIGPMFSGKSTELLRRVRRHRFGRKNILIVKHASDTRYTPEAAVVTHDRVTETSMCVSHLNELDTAVWNAADVIAIDEGQFMPDLIEFCDTACSSGKLVLVAALDGTFAKAPFGDVCNLIPRAERVDKLCAVCAACGDDAPFTRRLTEDTSVMLVGGNEAYLPVCRACYALPVARLQEELGGAHAINDAGGNAAF